MSWVADSNGCYTFRYGNMAATLMQTTAAASLKSADNDSVAPVWHTAVFLALVLVMIITYPIRLRLIQGHARVARYALSIILEFLLFGYVWVLGLRARKKTLREIIGGTWVRWTDPLRDFGVALVFWIVVACTLVVARVFLGENPEVTRVMRVLRPQTAEEMAAWVLMSVVAGFCEEIVFRGYLQRQFLAWTGNTPLAIVSQAVIFGAAHLYQGWKGAVTIAVYGGLFGILAVVRKSLRPGIIQHAMQDSFSGIALSLLMKHRHM